MPQTLDLRNQDDSQKSPEPHREPHRKEAPGAHPLLEWEATEFSSSPEQRRLLRIVGIVLLVSAIVPIFLGNLLFTFFLAIAGGLLIFYASRAPREVAFRVTSHGIETDKHRYDFEHLASFWISYDPPLFKELVLTSKRTFMPVIRIPLGNVAPRQLQELLQEFLEEKEREETIIDILAKRIGL